MSNISDLRKQIVPVFSTKDLEKKGIPTEDINIFKNYKIMPRELLVRNNWNYKEENADMLEKLTKNLKRIGQVENIHVRELETGYYEIINGMHRDESFEELNKPFVVVYDHGKISFEEAIRRTIETNETKFKAIPEKLSELLNIMKLEIPEIDLLDTLPFTDLEFNELSGLTIEQPEHAEVNEDEYNEPARMTHKSQKGDLFELNNHRLYCADSTNDDDVEKLMDGKICHMTYTDPPYNVNYAEFNADRGNGKDWGEAYCSEWKDKMSDDNYFLFLKKFISLGKQYMIDWGHWYIWHASSYAGMVQEALKVNEIPYDKIPICWVKQSAPIAWRRYKCQYEPAIFAGKGAINGAGKGARWFGPNNETNVWQISRDHNGSYVHPTQKPVALAARAITNSSQEGELVLDLFLGSGTTLIASDMLKRTCYGMEMEPIFCDMIVQRFMKYCTDNDIPCTVKRNGEIITESFFQTDGE